MIPSLIFVLFVALSGLIIYRLGVADGRAAERRERIQKRAHSMLHRDERRLHVVQNDGPDGAA